MSTTHKSKLKLTDNLFSVILKKKKKPKRSKAFLKFVEKYAMVKTFNPNCIRTDYRYSKIQDMVKLANSLTH